MLALAPQVRTSVVMMQVLPRVQDAHDRQMLHHDWEAGRRAFMFVLCVKLAPWHRLPLILCGVGHHDEAVARSVIRKAYDMYLQAPQSQQHSLTSLFFDPQGDLFQQLLQFLRFEVPRSQLDLLCYHAGRLALIPISERLIESLHAIMHKFVRGAPHHSVCHAALSMHLSEIKQAINDRSASLVDLANLCFKVRTPMDAVEQLGFAQHPVAKGAMERCAASSSLANRQHGPQLTEIVYRADPGTMFSSIRVAPSGPGGPPAEHPGVQDGAAPHEEPPLDEGLDSAADPDSGVASAAALPPGAGEGRHDQRLLMYGTAMIKKNLLEASKG